MQTNLNIQICKTNTCALLALLQTSHQLQLRVVFQLAIFACECMREQIVRQYEKEDPAFPLMRLVT